MLPVNFLLDAQAIVFSTGPGDKLAAVRAGRPLTFEADDIGRATRTGWSVLVTGAADVVEGLGQIRRIEQLRLDAWAPTSGRSFVRLRIQEVTGRLLPLRPGRVTVERVGWRVLRTGAVGPARCGPRPLCRGSLIGDPRRGLHRSLETKGTRMDIARTEAGQVVVGVDRSDCARDAVIWAADLAAAWGAPLHLVHVAAQEPPVSEAQPWLSGLLDIAERPGSAPPRTHCVWGSVVDVLAEHAAAARLVALGSYGEGARAGMLAGSVALGLLGRAACPVAIVRGPAPQVPPPHSGPVVVGVDGSPAGRAALRLAAGLAVSLRSPLVAVHTWSDVVAGPAGATRRTEGPEFLAAEAAALLDAELGGLARSYPDLPVERVVAEDTPLRALLDRAVAARLLVVGNRGDDRGSGMLGGSTSSSLVEFAQCPVVVTGPAGASDELSTVGTARAVR